MHNQRSAQDVAGEAAYPDWGTVTPVARVHTHTFGFRGIAFFRTSAHPLQVEVVADGRHQVIAIPDVQGRILGAVAVFFAVAVLLATLLRRTT